jgi:hypothetical protein
VLSKTVEQQDVTNQYSFDSVMTGINLDNLAQDKYVCYYFFYELEVQKKYLGQRGDALLENQIPFRVDYFEYAADRTEHGLKCSYSDAMQFFT